MSTISVTRASKLDKGITFATGQIRVVNGVSFTKPDNGDEFLITVKRKGDRRSLTLFARAQRNGNTLYCNHVPKGFTTPRVGRPTELQLVNIRKV